MKTVKQIADEIGVSKQAVNEKIAKLELTSTLRKIGNRFTIDEEQEALIKQAFEDKSPSNKTNDLAKNTTSVLGEIADIVKVLQEQLKVKDEQLAEKDKQIKDLTDTVKSQAQSINADRHNELAGTLQTQLIGGEVAEATPPMGFKERVKILFTGKI